MKKGLQGKSVSEGEISNPVPPLPTRGLAQGKPHAYLWSSMSSIWRLT